MHSDPLTRIDAHMNHILINHCQQTFTLKDYFVNKKWSFRRAKLLNFERKKKNLFK